MYVYKILLIILFYRWAQYLKPQNSGYNVKTTTTTTTHSLLYIGIISLNKYLINNSNYIHKYILISINLYTQINTNIK